MEARTPKTLISHLSTRINRVQYFYSLFNFYLKAMFILQTKLKEFNSKKCHEILMLHSR